MTLSEFAYGDESWNQVVGHLEQILAPFQILVTEDDPGQSPHMEIAICGQATNFGLSDVGGISVFTCEPIQNNLAFVFAEVHGEDARRIAEAAAYMVGSGFGLEPVFHCADIMSSLSDCGSKEFVDIDAPCGAFAAQPIRDRIW